MYLKIKHISFLYGDIRHYAAPNSRGRFIIMPSLSQNRQTPLSKRLTAKQFVENNLIKKSDPVITLDSGEKLRIFQGGDASAPLAASMSVVEAHDMGYKKIPSRERITIPDPDFFIDFPEW
jgi:hypothetical protein